MPAGREAATPGPPKPVEAERGEHWWPVALAIVVAVILHVALPSKYRINPPWVLPAVLGVLLAALIIGDPGRIDRQKTWLRVLTSIVIVCLTAANLVAGVRLVHDILTSNKLFANNANGLLATGGVIWATNIIAFSLWYWDLDRGGAAPPPRPPAPRTVRLLSSRRCCPPTTSRPPGCRGSSTTCRWASGPPPPSA